MVTRSLRTAGGISKFNVLLYISPCQCAFCLRLVYWFTGAHFWNLMIITICQAEFLLFIFNSPFLTPAVNFKLSPFLLCSGSGWCCKQVFIRSPPLLIDVKTESICVNFLQPSTMRQLLQYQRSSTREEERTGIIGFAVEFCRLNCQCGLTFELTFESFNLKVCYFWIDEGRGGSFTCSNTTLLVNCQLLQQEWLFENGQGTSVQLRTDP